MFWQRDNNDRANAAKAALNAYIATNTPQYDQESLEDKVGDLICDLMHLVHRDGEEGERIEGDPDFGFQPTDLLDRARSNFEEEEQEESEDEDLTDEWDDFEDYGARDPRNDRPNTDADPEDDED